MACRQLRGHPNTPVNSSFIPLRSTSETRGASVILTWILQVGGGHGLLDFIAQQIKSQVGRLQLQGGDEQVQDVDLGFMPDS